MNLQVCLPPTPFLFPQYDFRPLAYPNTIPIVTEPGEDSDDGRSSSSDDNMVNSVIEAAAPRSSEQRELEQLMAITTRMVGQSSGCAVDLQTTAATCVVTGLL